MASASFLLMRMPQIIQTNQLVESPCASVTYMDVAPDIRKRFAKAHKIKEQYFTFNGKGGCPVCGGKGVVIAEMAFMDNIETTCEACHGLRYSPEALQYTIDGKNIAQVMDLSVRRASEFFKGTSIEDKLQPMMGVGLHYLHLNQALSTLSGGELQRLKMASCLMQYTLPLDQGGQRGVFVIDEPTDGLHLKDVRHLIDLFEQMVEMGNTVYVIEHNTDVIKAADHVIELGPGAGDLGGTIIYQGTPAACSPAPPPSPHPTSEQARGNSRFIRATARNTDHSRALYCGRQSSLVLRAAARDCGSPR